MRTLYLFLLMTLCLILNHDGPSYSAEKLTYRTTSGLCFKVNPELKQDIEALVEKVRSDIRKEQNAGRIVAYLSVPISSRGGGHFDTNNKIAANTKESLERRFGSRLWVLNPAQYELRDGAGGGDYMAVWGDILGGMGGTGKDFPMVYFLGPEDVWSFFIKDKTDKTDILGGIERWLERARKNDEDLDKHLSTGRNYENFILFYGLRAASSFSKGAHDEWNIVEQLNRGRAIGDDIAVYFDGRAIEIADYSSRTDRGYAVQCP